MRVAVATVQVPFISGGAEVMTAGLRLALLRAGHEVEVVSKPFRFCDLDAIGRTMDEWAREDFDRFDCGPIDVVITLKFPAFYLQHPNKVVWLMHQHRSVYELFDTPFGDRADVPELLSLRDRIIRQDTETLSSARRIFTISQTVSDRLLHFNGLASVPLHQPPANAELFYSGPQLPYIFAPSRLELLKRQDLLIRAMVHVAEPVHAVIAGAGGQLEPLKRLTASLGLSHRVQFVGRLSDEAMRNWYAQALGVFFGPLQEDYGFVTLEAMLSSRAVVTCTDSGGPVHFVRDGETGCITAPEPGAIADAINRLWADRAWAAALGRNGLTHFEALNIRWERVVSELLGQGGGGW